MKITIGITVETVNHVNSINIESVLSQTLNSNDFKVIMINYQEDYAANYYFHKLKSQYNNLEQIKVTKNYKGNMKNEVLKDLDTEYVIFIEDNMILKPNALSELLTLVEISDGDMVVNQAACKGKKNRNKAKVIEDELLIDTESLTMYDTRVITDNKLEFITSNDKKSTMKAFYAKYLANSYGVAKYCESCLFDISKEESKQVRENQDDFFVIQEEIMISLSTGVAMTVENKIQSISQNYLTILHSDKNKNILMNKSIDQVDKKIWLRKLSEFTNRYLLDACMAYIPRQDLNLVRAIKNCDLEGVEIHLENVEVKNKIIPDIKHSKERVLEKEAELTKVEKFNEAEDAIKMINKKLEIVEARIQKILEKGE